MTPAQRRVRNVVLFSCVKLLRHLSVKRTSFSPAFRCNVYTKDHCERSDRYRRAKLSHEHKTGTWTSCCRLASRSLIRGQGVYLKELAWNTCSMRSSSSLKTTSSTMRRRYCWNSERLKPPSSASGTTGW